MTETENNEEYERIRKNALQIRKEIDELYKVDHNGFGYVAADEQIGERVNILQAYANKYPALTPILDDLPGFYGMSEDTRRKERLHERMQNSQAIMEARKNLGKPAVTNSLKVQKQKMHGDREQDAHEKANTLTKLKAMLHEIL